MRESGRTPQGGGETVAGAGHIPSSGGERAESHCEEDQHTHRGGGFFTYEINLARQIFRKTNFC